MATWREMIPVIPVDETPALVRSVRNLMQASLYGLVIGAPLPNGGAMPALPIPVHANDCLTSGDGYFRAHLADAIDTVGVLRGDEIRGTTVAPVREFACCGFTATAIVKKD